MVDNQIPAWLGKVRIDPRLLTSIKQIYESQIQKSFEDKRDGNMSKLPPSSPNYKEKRFNWSGAKSSFHLLMSGEGFAPVTQGECESFEAR